jgi:acyl carrier protein
MDKVKEIFCRVLGVAESEVKDETAYNSFEKWDSLKHLELVSALEDEFKINIEQDDVIDMENFRIVRETVKKYLDKKGK